MTSQQPAHPQLLHQFTRWWWQNKKGDFACRWRRRPVWGAQLIQKLGLEREVRAPLFWGGSMTVMTNERISGSLLTFGYAEPSITALMLHFLKDGDSMVDAGAHFGYETLLGSRLVGSRGSVIAFEPNPSAFRFASVNLRDSNNVRLEPKAVGDINGTAYLENRPISESGFNSLSCEKGGFDTTKVEIVRLDTLLADRNRRIDFLKCDVEGHELSVLRGAADILKNDQPLLVLEADMPSSDGMTSPRAHELAAYLDRYGYRPCNFDFDGQLQLGELDAFPVYHPNVAFVPRAHAALS